MPLVRDPAPTGRVNPEIAGPNSDEFRALARDHDLVVILQVLQGFSGDLPTAHSFTGFRQELRLFPSPAVLCAYFGEPLGVFTKEPSTLTNEDAQMLATQITAIEPHSVQCDVPHGR
jgi:hypothetical protein